MLSCSGYYPDDGGAHDNRYSMIMRITMVSTSFMVIAIGIAMGIMIVVIIVIIIVITIRSAAS